MLPLSSSNSYQTGSTLLLHLLGTLLATALTLPLAFASIQAVGFRTSVSAETRGNHHPLSPVRNQGKLPSIVPREFTAQCPLLCDVFASLPPQVQVTPCHHASSSTQECNRCCKPTQWRQEVVQLRRLARSDEQMRVDLATSDQPGRQQSRQRKCKPGTQRGIRSLHKWATNQEG